MTEPSHPSGTPQVGVYRERARIGQIALVARTVVAQGIILGGTIILARYLRPEDFGAFAMVQFILTVLTIFGDAGLGAALVQRPQTPSERDLSSAFFAQMGLGLMVVAVAYVAGLVLPQVWTELPESTPLLVLALALNFVLTSARVVPTLLMERELLFVRVAILDTINSVTFYLVASILAVSGFGVSALVLGVLAQGAAGFLAAYVLRFWRPVWAFDADVVKKLLAFGIPYQTRIALILGTRAVIPVVAGTMLSGHHVGTLTWALETSFFALTFVDIIARVSFPLYSRLQGSPRELEKELERSVRLSTSLTLCMSGIFVGLAPDITEIIYSAQWLEAVPLFRVYAVAVVFAVLVSLLAPAFDASGKPRIVVVQMVAVAVLVWVAVPLGVRQAGALGFAVGHAAGIAIGGVLIVWLAHRYLPRVPILRIHAVPLGTAVGLVALGHYVLDPWVGGPWTLAAAVVLEVALFVGLLWALDRRSFDVLRASLPQRGASA